MLIDDDDDDDDVDFDALDACVASYQQRAQQIAISQQPTSPGPSHAAIINPSAVGNVGGGAHDQGGPLHHRGFGVQNPQVDKSHAAEYPQRALPAGTPRFQPLPVARSPPHGAQRQQHAPPRLHQYPNLNYNQRDPQVHSHPHQPSVHQQSHGKPQFLQQTSQGLLLHRWQQHPQQQHLRQQQPEQQQQQQMDWQNAVSNQRPPGNCRDSVASGSNGGMDGTSSAVQSGRMPPGMQRDSADPAAEAARLRSALEEAQNKLQQEQGTVQLLRHKLERQARDPSSSDLSQGQPPVQAAAATAGGGSGGGPLTVFAAADLQKQLVRLKTEMAHQQEEKEDLRRFVETSKERLRCEEVTRGTAQQAAKEAAEQVAQLEAEVAVLRQKPPPPPTPPLREAAAAPPAAAVAPHQQDTPQGPGKLSGQKRTLEGDVLQGRETSAAVHDLSIKPRGQTAAEAVEAERSALRAAFQQRPADFGRSLLLPGGQATPLAPQSLASGELLAADSGAMAALRLLQTCGSAVAVLQSAQSGSPRGAAAPAGLWPQESQPMLAASAELEVVQDAVSEAQKQLRLLSFSGAGFTMSPFDNGLPSFRSDAYNNGSGNSSGRSTSSGGVVPLMDALCKLVSETMAKDPGSHPTSAAVESTGRDNSAVSSASLQVAALRGIAALVRVSAAAAAAASHSCLQPEKVASRIISNEAPGGGSSSEARTPRRQLSQRVHLRAPAGGDLPLPPLLRGSLPRQQPQELSSVSEETSGGARGILALLIRAVLQEAGDETAAAAAAAVAAVAEGAPPGASRSALLPLLTSGALGAMAGGPTASRLCAARSMLALFQEDSVVGALHISIANPDSLDSPTQVPILEGPQPPGLWLGGWSLLQSWLSLVSYLLPPEASGSSNVASGGEGGRLSLVEHLATLQVDAAPHLVNRLGASSCATPTIGGSMWHPRDFLENDPRSECAVPRMALAAVAQVLARKQVWLLQALLSEDDSSGGNNGGALAQRIIYLLDTATRNPSAGVLNGLLAPLPPSMLLPPVPPTATPLPATGRGNSAESASETASAPASAATACAAWTDRLRVVQEALILMRALFFVPDLQAAVMVDLAASTTSARRAVGVMARLAKWSWPPSRSSISQALIDGQTAAPNSIGSRATSAALSDSSRAWATEQELLPPPLAAWAVVLSSAKRSARARNGAGGPVEARGTAARASLAEVRSCARWIHTRLLNHMKHNNDTPLT